MKIRRPDVGSGGCGQSPLTRDGQVFDNGWLWSRGCAARS
jgi:hypothetical protein